MSNKSENVKVEEITGMGNDGLLMASGENGDWLYSFNISLHDWFRRDSIAEYRIHYSITHKENRTWNRTGKLPGDVWGLYDYEQCAFEANFEDYVEEIKKQWGME